MDNSKIVKVIFKYKSGVKMDVASPSPETKKSTVKLEQILVYSMQ